MYKIMFKHKQFFILMGFKARSQSDGSVFWLKEMPDAWMLLKKEDIDQDGYLKPEAFSLETYSIRTEKDLMQVRKAFEEMLNVKSAYEVAKKCKALNPVDNDFDQKEDE